MRCVSISRARCDFIYRGVLSVLQQQLTRRWRKRRPAGAAPDAGEPDRRGRQPVLRGQSEAREPATRFSITPSRESAASAANRAARAGRMRNRVTRSSRGALSSVARHANGAKARVTASGGGTGRSQPELWQSADDCWPRLRAAGARGRSGAAVVDRCRALAAPGAVDPGSRRPSVPSRC